MKNKISMRIGMWNTPPCIRKFLTSLKALTLLLVMLMSVNVWGAEKTYTHAFTTAPTASADNTLSSVVWTFGSGTNLGSYNSGNYAGVQLGTKNATGSITMTTKNNWGEEDNAYKEYTKIKEVYVWLNNGTGSISATVKIGGVAATASGTVSKNSQAKSYSDASKITYTPASNSNTGKIEIAFSTSSKAGYFCAVEVVCEEGDTPTEPVAPSITTQPEGASYEKDATATALTIAASGNPTPTYQWYSNTTESTSGASLISGATNASYTPSTATIGTKYYYCVATNTQGSATSDIVAVTITAALPKITITASSISDFSGSYADRTWTADGVSGKCFAYKSSELMQFNSTPYVYNTTEVPGKIKSIKIVKGGGSDRSWSVYCGTSALTSTEGGTQIGTSQTVSTSYTWTVPDNTEYTYFYITKGSSSTQISEFVITYEELASTNEAVTFAAPADGSLVIKNGATPINSGTTIQDGTVLGVEFGMTPAEAYKDVAIKVTKTDGGDDVTSTVYNATKKQITMPRYPITVAVTFTKLYKIEAATVTGGTLSWEDANNAKPTYVEAGTYIQALQEEATHYEFKSFDIYKTDDATTKVEDAEGMFEMPAYDVTISGTFEEMQCTALPSAPVLVTPTISYAEGVTLNWTKLDAASGYLINVWKGSTKVVEDEMIEDVNTLSYKITAELGINTEYSYSIAGIGDDETYCMIGNPANESTFTTADYPAVVLTLSENENTTPVNGKLNTPITLPTVSTQACDGKVFMGWSENAIDGEVAKEQVTLLEATYTFDNPSVLTKTIYAVYAAVVSEGQDSYQKTTSLATGDKVIFATEDNSKPSTGVTGANSNNKDATVSETASDWMIFTVEAGSAQGTFKFKNGTNYITAASSAFKLTTSASDFTLNESSQAIWTSGSDKYALLKNSDYYRHYKTSNSYTKFYVWKVIHGEKTYGNYCTTCQAAVAAPTFGLEGGNYSEAKTLTLSATEGDIYYTINDGEETKYTAAIALNNRGTYEISAYAKIDDRTSDIVTKTYTLNWAYTLDELAASDVASGTSVQVTFENKEITGFYTNGQGKRYGIYVNVQKGGKDVEIYCNQAEHPNTWETGGVVSSKQAITGTWTYYSGGSQWEFCPSNWNDINYTAPAKITSLVITGDVDNKNYTAGQKLDFTGLTVTGVYSDNTDQNAHTEDVTDEISWTEVTLTENQPEATATATLNNAKTGNVAVNASKTITGLTVGAAKTLESIYVADDSEHKKTFFVGRPFSAEGLKVMAHYNMGDDQQIAVANLNITNTTFSEAEAEHAINISYTENGVEKTTSYNVEVTYMNLNDLVAATDINDHDHVYVKFENVMITKLVNKGILLNVQKGDKDIEIYNQSANCPNTWEQYGTVSATLNNVEWTNYQGTWEFKISNWDVVEYAAPNIPVTSMEISPAEVSVGETKTTTLSIIYDPTNATNTGVTWAVTEGSDYASVDEEGVVTGLAVGTATITATLKADENITATRTVTVTETAKCEISYYVKGEVASTQNIAREEEGTLTYVPELEVAGYTFAGWAEDAIAEETATATLISTYTPAADEATKSVYAIYKRVDDSSPTYQQYAKVTSALTDWSGDYLIAYSDEIFANGQKGGKDDEGAIGKQYVIANPGEALSGNVVTKEWGDQYKVTLEEISAGSNTYVLKTQDGKYNYQTSNANGLTASSTKSTAAQYPISVTFTSENDVKLALGGGAAGAVFRYNTDQYFRYYKNGGQNAVYLYKYDEGSALYTSNPVAKVKVTFNLDGGVGGCGTITVNEGEDVTLCDAAPTKDLNKFKAWSDGVNEYAPSATITNVTEDIELTARWIAKKQYTISFNKGGAAGTTPASIKDYEYNEVTLPAQGDLSNPGYIFGGWNDGETTYAGGATFTMPEKNVSMTAVWVLKTNDKWYLVTSADQLAAGKQYAIVANDKDAAMGAKPSDEDYMAKVTASFNDDKSMMIAIDPSAVILTLGGNATDGWTLSNNGQYLGSSTVKKMAWSTEVGDANKWEITIADGEGDYEAKIKNTVGYLCYNAGSPRFTTYSSVQSKVQLYVLVPAKAIDEEVNASTLDAHADVTVNEGGNLLVTEGDIELGDVYVMEGGKVTIQGTATLTVNNFVIKSTMAGGKSGQVIGVTSNLTITSNAYFDVTLGDNANPEKWHAFAVPFNVDAINGIYDLDDNKLTNEVNYAIMSYHGDVRAQGQYGWKKFRGIMNPGVFYLMTVDGERTTYRMKMNGVFSASSTEISVQQYASGITTDAGWNGIANNQLGYSSIGVDVQVLNPTSYTYEVMTASTYNFTVGTPFFYQANATGTIDLTAPNAGENYAPRRVGAAEIKNVAIRLSNAKYTDHLYLSATDEATNEYQIGRDLVKMTMTNTPAVPQIFAEAYGNKLCMVDAPMVNEEATYALNLYAPAAGEYTIGAAQVEGYELFLTQGGVAIWNLSMGETAIELKKGNNNGYGIVIKKAHNTTTDVENVFGNGENIQKFIFNDNLYIVRDGKVFDAQGKLVK
ncbi:MAG: Ig-like domain-containing protein [Paludibacteraceae bacterium]|nr:Ig-like domain-containing protein [Paludibacteraceae bacterium]